VVANSGAGYNYETVAVTKGQDLVNSVAKQREDLQVAEDGVQKDGQVATYNYKATFKGPSAISAGNVIGNLF
jgi:hypothetical protein